MSQIKGKWTRPERKVHGHLKSWHIRHRMHPKMEGNPDIVLTEKKVAIFIDGCFWHKCPMCFQMPATRKKFWKKKISHNVLRDRYTDRLLKQHGYRVIRIWEHSINKEFLRKTFRH